MARAKLPFYSLYPSDFDQDEAIRGMTDEEVGFYVRCLNHAWINNGLPPEHEEIERVIPGRRDHEAFERIWKRVSRCWVLIHTQGGPRLVNARQEDEREKAAEKSAINRQKVNKRWAREREGRERFDTTVPAQYEPGNTLHNHIQNPQTPCSPSETVNPKLWAEFERLTKEYPNATDVDYAAQVWMTLCERGELTEANVSEVWAGLDRYRVSDLWSRDAGRYIIGLGKWLHGKRWKDNPQPSAEAKAARKKVRSSDGRDPYAEWVPPAEYVDSEVA